ncbi:hypothetical protein D3C84_770900 [compost metagenome]
MTQAGVHRDAGLCARQHLADTGQVQLRQDFGVLEACRNALGTGLLRRIAPRQFHAHTEITDTLGQLAPVGFGPVFGVPSGAVQKQHVGILAR